MTYKTWAMIQKEKKHEEFKKNMSEAIAFSMLLGLLLLAIIY